MFLQGNDSQLYRFAVSEVVSAHAEHDIDRISSVEDRSDFIGGIPIKGRPSVLSEQQLQLDMTRPCPFRAIQELDFLDRRPLDKELQGRITLLVRFEGFHQCDELGCHIVGWQLGIDQNRFILFIVPRFQFGDRTGYAFAQCIEMFAFHTEPSGTPVPTEIEEQVIEGTEKIPDIEMLGTTDRTGHPIGIDMCYHHTWDVELAE